MRAADLAAAIGVGKDQVSLWLSGKRVCDDGYAPRIVAAIEAFEPAASDAWFWRRVSVGAPDDCWEWQGYRVPLGYGQARHDRLQQRAHRWAWELTHGPIPEGRWVLHRCDNPPCCNPAHLFLGDALANVQDMHAKGRQRIVNEATPPFGEVNPQHKLTDAQVLEIRAKYSTGAWIQKDLAKVYGISPALVSFVVTGRAWKHITHGRDCRTAS